MSQQLTALWVMSDEFLENSFSEPEIEKHSIEVWKYKKKCISLHLDCTTHNYEKKFYPKHIIQ